MAFILAVLLLLSPSAPKPAINAKSDNLALRGYDAVAYFSDGRPAPGVAPFETTWHGATWRFASAEHRDRFIHAPDAYAPQFGGYCAWAVAHGYTADGDPEVWKIVDGQLYVNYSKRVQRKWEQNIPEYIRQGQSNWPAVLNT